MPHTLWEGSGKSTLRPHVFKIPMVHGMAGYIVWSNLKWLSNIPKQHFEYSFTGHLCNGWPVICGLPRQYLIIVGVIVLLIVNNWKMPFVMRIRLRWYIFIGCEQFRSLKWCIQPRAIFSPNVLYWANRPRSLWLLRAQTVRIIWMYQFIYQRLWFPLYNTHPSWLVFTD